MMTRSKWLLLVTCLVMGLVGGAGGQYIFGQAETLLHQPGDFYYEDVSADSPHAEDIGYAREAGIARGLSDTVYGPEWDVPREQMATFEMRAFTAGIVFALQVASVMDARDDGGPGWLSLPSGDLEDYYQWVRDQADLMNWAAELIEFEDATRPADAIGTPRLYESTAFGLRELADWMMIDVPSE